MSGLEAIIESLEATPRRRPQDASRVRSSLTQADLGRLQEVRVGY
jgi:hypothetical protein